MPFAPGPIFEKLNATSAAADECFAFYSSPLKRTCSRCLFPLCAKPGSARRALHNSHALVLYTMHLAVHAASKTSVVSTMITYDA